MSKIIPFIWFDHEAREAAEFYVEVFRGNAKITHTYKMEGTPSGKVEIISLEIFGQEFTLMSAGPFDKINSAISFVINCNDQEEVDYYWNKLSADKAAEQCGWLRDKFGVSWQVVPRILNKLLEDPDPKKAKQVSQVMLKMKKLVIDDLLKAYETTN